MNILYVHKMVLSEEQRLFFAFFAEFFFSVFCCSSDFIPLPPFTFLHVIYFLFCVVCSLLCSKLRVLIFFCSFHTLLALSTTRYVYMFMYKVKDYWQSIIAILLSSFFPLYLHSSSFTSCSFFSLFSFQFHDVCTANIFSNHFTYVLCYINMNMCVYVRLIVINNIIQPIRHLGEISHLASATRNIHSHVCSVSILSYGYLCGCM